MTDTGAHGHRERHTKINRQTEAMKKKEGHYFIIMYTIMNIGNKGYAEPLHGLGHAPYASF